MKTCPSCDYERVEHQVRCPECGAYYSKVFQLIAEEEAYEAEHSFKGRWQKMWNAPNRKQAMLAELKLFWQGLTPRGKFALFIIYAFVFMLVITVM
jgi:predicted ATP-dependent serine protease